MLNSGEVAVKPRQRSRRDGFTLIEMIVVVAILVILAGFILPKLDRVQLKSNKGVAAANMGGLSRYIQTYRVYHNLYPDRWDSLLNSAGTALQVAGDPAGGTTGLDPQLVGGPPAGSPTKLSTALLSDFNSGATEKPLRSLARMGIANVQDWSGSGLPGDSFTIVRALATNSRVATLNVVATGGSVKGLGTGAAADPLQSDEDAIALVDHIYPQNRLSNGLPGAIPAGKALVVFGFGPSNGAVGDVLQEAPNYANTDAAHFYNRLLAIFEVSAGGSRCELKAVVGGDADRIDEELNDYFE